MPAPKRIGQCHRCVDQPGDWVLDDGCKTGIGSQNALADVIDRRGQQGDAVGVAAVQVHFSADLGFDRGHVRRHPCGCEGVEEELFQIGVGDALGLAHGHCLIDEKPKGEVDYLRSCRQCPQGQISSAFDQQSVAQYHWVRPSGTIGDLVLG